MSFSRQFRALGSHQNFRRPPTPRRPATPAMPPRARSHRSAATVRPAASTRVPRRLSLRGDHLQTVGHQLRRLRRRTQRRIPAGQHGVTAARLPPDRGADGITDRLAARHLRVVDQPRHHRPRHPGDTCQIVLVRDRRPGGPDQSRCGQDVTPPQSVTDRAVRRRPVPRRPGWRRSCPAPIRVAAPMASRVDLRPGTSAWLINRDTIGRDTCALRLRSCSVQPFSAGSDPSILRSRRSGPLAVGHRSDSDIAICTGAVNRSVTYTPRPRLHPARPLRPDDRTLIAVPAHHHPGDFHAQQPINHRRARRPRPACRSGAPQSGASQPPWRGRRTAPAAPAGTRRP